MEITVAEVEDAEAILQLQKLAYQSEAAIYDDHSIPPLRETLPEVQAAFATHRFLKAVIDGRIVGSVRARQIGTTCHVARLIVHPSVQNRGIGTALMREIEAMHGEAERFELFTGSKSQRNLYLYQKLGYQVCGTGRQTDRVSLVYLAKTVNKGP